MENPTHTVDKAGWPDGPWMSEPDRIDFEHAGFPCMILRGPMGNLCGYVAVPPGHPLHGKDYNDPPVNVHGGLTYADACRGHICHVPKPGEPDNVWWFGFDCGHAFDLSPRVEMTMAQHRLPPVADGYEETYKDVSYVRAEVASLAEQLAALRG